MRQPAPSPDPVSGEGFAPEPRSFWLARPRAPRRAAFLVVGGGLVGLSTAYWLAKAGSRVEVLEAAGVAHRASGRNAGFLLTGSAEPFTRLAEAVGEARALAFWELSRDNRELLRAELLDARAERCDFLAEGSWIAALDDGRQIAELEASADKLARAGLDFRWVEGEELAAASGSRRLGAAIHQPRDGGLDPYSLAHELVAAGGFTVHSGVRARRVERDGDGVRVVADGGDWLAERAVVAVNAYAPALLPHLAAEVRPVRGQMLATGPGERRLEGVWYVDDGFQYLRQLGDGTLLLGGCRQSDEAREVGYTETPTARVQAALERFLAEVFPALSGRPIERRWAGTMAFTADGLPRLGEVPGVPGALYAAGLNGHGLSLGFALGRHLARLASGESPEPLLPPG